MLRPLLLFFLCLIVQSCRRPVEPSELYQPSLSEHANIAPAEVQRTATTTRSSASAPSSDAAALIRPLIDPAKLATLGDRGANTRVQKITAILWDVKVRGQDPAVVAAKAVEFIGWGGTERGRLTAAAMVRNVTILERLGGTTPGDLDDLRHGKTATVRKGPYTGEVLSVDHIIPRAVAPELDNVIVNLELMPLSVKQKKNDKIGDRQVSLAKAFHDAGLLSDEGLRRVLGAKR